MKILIFPIEIVLIVVAWIRQQNDAEKVTVITFIRRYTGEAR